MANKKQTNVSNKPDKKFLDLLYMTPSTLKARDISDLLKDFIGITIELWEEMNVLELQLITQNTIYFEPLDVNFKDPSDAAFVKNRNIQTIFTINLAEEDLPTIKACFEQIISQFSGFLCLDSEDFKPIYAGSTALLPD
ncbi:MAG TPA: hypothetical protein VJ888_10285 [Mobilitalea sp.]|nr:hypothetical protein [Mobilitalea sp.]